MIRMDPLTGLAERGALDQFLQDIARKVDRYGMPVTCALVDLDDFKEVNDTHGHPEGDRVLQAWGQFVRQRLRGTAHAARLGGDEFVLLFENRRRASVRRTLQKWVHELSQKGLAGYLVGMSAGVAGVPEDTTDVYELLPLADQALYLAKAKGKGTVAYPDVGRVRLEWPPPYVPRPVEQRMFLTLLRERPVVVVKGPQGSGKTRMVQEVLGKKALFWDPDRETWPESPDKIGVVKNVHRLTLVGWGRIGQVLQEGGRCVLIVSDEEAQTVEARLQPLFGKHRVGELQISPMGAASFRRLLERALGGMVPPGLVEDLLELSGGLPGLAGLLLQSFVKEGWLSRERTHWSYWGLPPFPRPSGLHHLWEERKRGMDKEARDLIGLLGLGGGKLPGDLLVSLARGVGQFRSIAETLADLEERGWICVVQKDGSEEIHLRETVWSGFGVGELDPEMRRHAADWLLQRWSNRLAEKLSIALLSFVDPHRHEDAFLHALQEAVHRLDIWKIGNLLLWTPRSLQNHSVIREARLWFLRSTGKIHRLLEEMPDPPPLHLRWMVLDALGDLGKFEEAFRLAQRWDATGRDASPELRASVASLHLIAGKNQDAEKILRDLRKQTLSPFVCARVEYGLGELARLQGQDARALRHYRRALDALERTSYARGQALLLMMQAEVMVQRGWLKEATRIYEQALPRAREAHALDVEGYGSHMLGEVLLERGYIARAQTMLREARRLLQVAGARRFLPFVLDDLAFLSLLVGDWTSAQGYLGLFARFSRDILSDEYRLHEGVARIWLLVLKDREDLPVDPVREIAPRVSTRGFRRLAFAALLWGDKDVLLSLRQEGERHTAGEVRMVQVLMGGVIGAEEGNGEEMIRAFRRARRWLARTGSPFWYAFYLVARGRAHRYLGKYAHADRAFREASEMFARLGARPLADHALQVAKP